MTVFINVCTILGALLILTSLSLTVCHLGVSLYGRVFDKGAATQQAWAANRLKTAAWWFSEDDTTRQLLMDLGNSNLQEWEARDRWRERRQHTKVV
jgi:hypothetical protein